MNLKSLLLTVFLAGCTTGEQLAPDAAALVPRASYHQHLLSPAVSALWSQPEAFDADDLIAQLDAVGIRRAAVLSVAYTYGDERRDVTDREGLTRAENDWTAAQIARYPDRLVGFCGVNPLLDFAIAEMERCTRLPHMRGVKLHFGNSGVNLRNPEHVRQVAAFFRAANARRLPIIVHLRTRVAWPFGRQDAETFLSEVLPAAPDSLVQVAHMAGAGPGYPDFADEAMGVFVDAIAANDRRTRNVYFDLTTVVWAETTTENAALLAQRLRQVGLRRILFGADLSIGNNPTPGEQWATFREKMPLTPAELAVIAGNVAPYLR